MKDDIHWIHQRYVIVLQLPQHRLAAKSERYGEIVRAAPNEISFANPEAWNDIYCLREGHKPFPKNQIWWGEFPGRAPSLVSTQVPQDHERMRRIWSQCFTSKALKAQEATVQAYSNLMVEKLRERATATTGTKTTVVNLADWSMFVTLDIIGDLGFGESFHCLNRGEWHPWAAAIFSYFKIGALTASIRFYPELEGILMKLIPRSVQTKSEELYQWAVKKIHWRLNMETRRTDFVTSIMGEIDTDKGLSVAELENNTNVIIVSGSETCGTVLTGTLNYLIKSDAALRSLAQEIRSCFKSPGEMTFAALGELPYLNAVISEGLRLSPPVPNGLQHVVPSGGDTVCGEWLPQEVSFDLQRADTGNPDSLDECIHPPMVPISRSTAVQARQ